MFKKQNKVQMKIRCYAVRLPQISKSLYVYVVPADIEEHSVVLDKSSN